MIGTSFSIDQFDAEGIVTRRLLAGRGEPLIFLHGVSGHLESFVPVAAKLAERYEIHLLDMLGHGFTAMSAGPLTVDVLADHIERYMNAAGLKKAHIAGQSLGAWTALWLAAHKPSRVDSLIISATAGSPIAGFADTKIGEMARANNLQGILHDDLAKTRERLGAMIKDPGLITEEFAQIRYSFYQKLEFRAAVDNLMALTHADIFDRFCLKPEILKRVTNEVLLIWGNEKIDSNPNSPAFLQRDLPLCKLVILKNCGHWPAFERPVDYAQLATNFLADGLSSVTAGEI
jgi:2-hydroxy-6-oxonona-2,4-dienedioate hydrolase